MRKGSWIIAASGVFGISVLANMPAQLVIPESSGRLQLLGIGGSVWRGEVKQILYDGKALPYASDLVNLLIVMDARCEIHPPTS